MDIEPDHTSTSAGGMASESGAALRRGLAPSSSTTNNSSNEFFPTMLLRKSGESGDHDDNGPLISSSAVKTVEQVKKSFGGKEGKPFVREKEDAHPNIDNDKPESPARLQTSPDPAEDNSMDVEEEARDSDEAGDFAESESEEEDDDEEDDNEKEEGSHEADGDSDDNEMNQASEVGSDIGETEDELKVNAAGRQASSSDEDEGSDVGGSDEDVSDDSDVEEVPWSRSRNDKNLLTFVSGKTAASTLGKHVHRPTPVSGGSRDNSPSNINLDDNKDEDMSDDSSSSSSSSSSSGERGQDVDLEDNNSSGGSENANDRNDSDEEESVSSEDSEDSNMDEIDEENNDHDDDDDESTDDNEDEDEDLPNESKLSSSSIEAELGRALDRDEGQNEAAEGPSETRKGKQPDLLKRESICSMEELENIINESPKEGAESGLESDMEFSDTEPAHTKPTPPNDFSDEEVAGLLSDSFEFDYWSNDTVSAVVKVLSTVRDTDHDLKCSQYPIRLPSSENASFWIDKMLVAVSPQSQALQLLEDSPEMRQCASKRIYDMFYRELSALDISHVDLFSGEPTSDKLGSCAGRHLFVGPFAAAESRLALAALHIKRVIQISGHPLDELWVGDGVKYSTHILPRCDKGGVHEICDVIARAASEVASALEDKTMTGEGTSVLVACSTGDEHACAVCALFLMQTFGIEQAAAIEWMVKMRESSNIDASWIEVSATKLSSTDNGVPKVSPATSKRVLSSQMLSALLKDPSSSESPKRQRIQFGPLEHTKKPEAVSTTTFPDLPLFSLGEPAQATLIMRNPEKDSSADEEETIEYERRLGEELADRATDQDESEPVPLLTPPASPLVIHSKEGDATVCEWPSNLAVDSAMTSAINLARPLTPNSLQKQEEDEERRLAQTPRSDVKNPPNPATGLTPKLQGISVSFR